MMRSVCYIVDSSGKMTTMGSTDFNGLLPYSGLTSLDYGKDEVHLYSKIDKDLYTECNGYTISTVYSDRLRQNYNRFFELREKYKLTDVWSGKMITDIHDFLVDILEDDSVVILDIYCMIDLRGMDLYRIRVAYK